MFLRDWTRFFFHCFFPPHFRFANDELESLFDRYLLKVQHGSLSATVGLFIVLTAILSGLSFGLLARPTVENIFYSIQCLVFVILLILLATKALEDTHLSYVNYVVLFFAAAFVVVGLPVSFGLSEPVERGGMLSLYKYMFMKLHTVLCD